ncbi:MAG: hypothetical protein IAE82_19325 [Opitutaceae bacterium]|nr:hypothetical protein [Opitutaceae bacterium]
MVASRPSTVLLGTLAGVLAAAGLGTHAGAADDVARATLTFSGTATLEQSYDTNVMLQSVAGLAEIESWVTALSANLGAEWRGVDGTTARLGYAPTWTQFEARESEDSIAQRLTASLGGKAAGGTYAVQGSAAFVDGSHDSVVFSGIGGAPATGGATVRDRRDQGVYRASARAEWKRGDWFARPVASLYLADFRTRQSAQTGYLNHVDRDDLNAGLDLGRAVRTGLSAYLGYRYGGQDQDKLLAYPEEYDNTYDRILAGLDGALAPWLSVALAAGPEFRRYGPHVHATFPDRDVTLLYLDATATATVARTDVVAMQVKQFQQLSFAGRGAFDDLNIDLAWRHTFSPRASAGLTLHAYNTDFLAPAVRDDWLCTARLQGSFTLSAAWTIEASLLLERGDSAIAAMPGREYDRSVTSLSFRAKL